jgi:hypothetical protein
MKESIREYFAELIEQETGLCFEDAYRLLCPELSTWEKMGIVQKAIYRKGVSPGRVRLFAERMLQLIDEIDQEQRIH